MLIKQSVLSAILFILSLAIVEIQSCPPLLIPLVAGAAGAGGMFAAGRHVGSKRDNNRPTPPDKNIGCFADGIHSRDMGKLVLDDPGMTRIMCQHECTKAETKYYAMQNGTECYCSNTYGKFGEVSKLKCNIPCPGSDEGSSKSEICGGNLANLVFEL